MKAMLLMDKGQLVFENEKLRIPTSLNESSIVGSPYFWYSVSRS
jgi:hypothetical protein